jgi:hypothetical protein
MDNWHFFGVDKSVVYEIINFDDGNDKYQKYINRWYIYGSWRGKVAIINAEDQNIRLASISKWKLLKLTCVLSSSSK